MTRLETSDAVVLEDASEVKVKIATDGDQAAAETVHMHLRNALQKAFGGSVEEKPADECSGFVDIDWERRFEIISEQGGDGS